MERKDGDGGRAYVKPVERLMPASRAETAGFGQRMRF